MKHSILASLLVAASVVPASAVSASPAMSFGARLHRITVPEAERRAEAALRAEGYAVAARGEGIVYGTKGIHTACFNWSVEPSGEIRINVVVASRAVEVAAPFGESERLLARFASPAPAARPSGRPGLDGGPAGTRSDEAYYEFVGVFKGERDFAIGLIFDLGSGRLKDGFVQIEGGFQEGDIKLSPHTPGAFTGQLDVLRFEGRVLGVNFASPQIQVQFRWVQGPERPWKTLTLTRK